MKGAMSSVFFLSSYLQLGDITKGGPPSCIGGRKHLPHAKNRVGSKDRLDLGRGRKTEKLQDENVDKGRREREQPKTEWAGMTDWVKAGQGKRRKPETEWAGITDWVEAMKRGKALLGEVENRQERAKDRVGRNDRLSPGGGREWMRK